MTTGVLCPQKLVGKNPTAQILLELFDHKIWKWTPKDLFDLLLEDEPVGLDQLVECGLFGFALLTPEMALSSEIAPWLVDPVPVPTVY